MLVNSKIEVKQTIDPGERWEDGVDHHPETEDLMAWLQDYDKKFCNYEYSELLSSGGDGDPGESLMYLMDEYFAARDSEATQSSDTGKPFYSSTIIAPSAPKYDSEKVFDYADFRRKHKLEYSVYEASAENNMPKGVAVTQLDKLIYLTEDDLTRMLESLRAKS